MSIVDDNINEMREQFSSFKIIEDSGEGILRSARVFLYEKDYGEFEAKLYADLLPACSLGSEIYKNNEFQYAISTWSGEWKENLKMLEEVLEKMSKKGFDAVKHLFYGDKLGILEGKF